jgi:hypothetical protein
MHKASSRDDLTDTIRMFRMGVEGRKPHGHVVGVQPGWFYKGDGSSIVATDSDICAPAFAQDRSEELDRGHLPD